MSTFNPPRDVFSAAVFTQSARVECFTNLNPMTAQIWPSAIQVNDVLVMTAQMFVNMLTSGVARVSEFDLMVSAFGLQGCRRSAFSNRQSSSCSSCIQYLNCRLCWQACACVHVSVNTVWVLQMRLCYTCDQCFHLGRRVPFVPSMSIKHMEHACR